MRHECTTSLHSQSGPSWNDITRTSPFRKVKPELSPFRKVKPELSDVKIMASVLGIQEE
jgi:hypothetical protein